MEVNNKEMYHYHHSHLYKDIWKPGNEFIVDDNFETSFLNILKYYSSAVTTITGNKNAFNRTIQRYLEENQDKETYIMLLKEARRIISGANMFTREMALEEVRKQKYPELPSRKHSIWLCEKKGLDFWANQLVREQQSKLDLYKVLVTGNLFKSSDSFLPEDYYTYENMLKSADGYWNPKFENEEQEEKAEYLFQGKVKILEKVK
ncbi:MAG: DUF2441 domain-containing protein [Bacilli bacterium]|nr:DUF2441 domain-containing protein [Bacilli bacterium]